MSDFIDGRLTPALWLLGDWSVRLALAVAVLAVVLAVRPPRRVATRFLLCRLVLLGGLLLPLTPRLWAVPLPHLSSRVSRVDTEEETPMPPPRPEDRERPMPSAPARTPVPPGRPVAAPLPVAPPVTVWQPPAPAEGSAPLRPGQWLALLLGVAWAGGTLTFGGRLLLGWRWLARLRRAATPVGQHAGEIFRACCRASAVRRQADLAAHPAVAAPILLGGRRPCIIVPTSWEDLPAATQRVCLLHELAHLARRDDWARLAEEALRAVFFFHPFVHWLLNRLDGERERLCDAMVVRQGVAPRQLAQTLADFARRLGPGRQALTRALALPFFNRVTVRDRIQQLLEDDMNRWCTPLPWCRAVTLAGAVLGLAAGLGGIGGRAEDPKPAATPPAAPAAPAAADGVNGVVQDRDGKPVGGAMVVLGPQTGEFQPRVVRTNADGTFAFSPLPAHYNRGMALVILAGKEGYAPVQGHASPPLGPAYRRVVLTLAEAHAFAGVVRDQKGKPVPGAEVQFGVVEKSADGRFSSWGYAPVEALRGTPLESFFLTRTDDEGRFRLTHVPADKELILRVTAAGMADLDTGANGPTNQFFAKPDARPAELVLGPEARVRGRVATKLPGVSVGGLSVVLQGTGRRWMFHRQTKTDAAGHFSFSGLGEGAVEVSVGQAPAGAAWTARAVRVEARPGGAAEATIELIEGVRVEGRVVVAGTGKPAAGALVTTTGPARPQSGPVSLTATTDAEGRYSFCLPPGETEFSVRLAPKGSMVDREKGGLHKVVIPADAKAFTVPPLTVTATAALQGQVVDAQGRPVAHARIVGLCRAGVCAPVSGPAVVTDTDGRFRLERGAAGSFPLGEVAALQVALAGGRVFDVNTVAVEGGVRVQLPTNLGTAVQGPADVEPGELAGVVVDDKGRPLEGVHVHVWHWVDRPENQTRTGKDGIFRIKKCGENQSVEVRFRKPGYSPVLFLSQPTGVKDWVVALDSKTYFEGVVRGPDGKPAPGARIRADQGPKMPQPGYLITHIYTDTKTDADGRYRLYVCPDAYEVSVRAPGIGGARLPKTAIDHGQARALDIQLQPGITFRARVVDAQDGRPVAGVRLWNWEDKQVEGRSDAKGDITIGGMVPGRIQLDVEAAGYARWWSAEATSEWGRLQRHSQPGSDWQRNFDQLDFDVAAGMRPVTIVVEKGVRVRGRVVDPDGQPVAGATVAPALTGTGNSLTGDTRFSVETKADGRFEVLLPASGPARYNLVAHDGKYQQWRKWANGVLPPFRTTPGQEVNDVTLTLSRPATVRGKVVDAQGKPVAHREVRAHAADELENRYYDPTTQTREDGTFELRFIRPGDQLIQAAPFYLDAEQAPPDSTRRLHLKAGATVEGVELRGDDAERP